jgi:hypothetical protein
VLHGVTALHQSQYPVKWLIFNINKCNTEIWQQCYMPVTTLNFARNCLISLVTLLLAGLDGGSTFRMDKIICSPTKNNLLQQKDSLLRLYREVHYEAR